MKIHKLALIEKACSTDKDRPALFFPYIDTSESGKPVVVATNGKIMAIVPAVAQESEAGRLSVAPLKLARKQGPQDCADIEVDPVTRAHKLLNGNVLPREDEADGANYPNWRGVLPSPHRVIIARIALNPALLLNLAQAMAAGESVVLEIEGADKPVTVRPGYSGTTRKPVAPHIPDAFGLIMPMIQPKPETQTQTT